MLAKKTLEPLRAVQEGIWASESRDSQEAFEEDARPSSTSSAGASAQSGLGYR